MDGKHLTNEEKLNEIYELVHENHQILKTLRRQQYLSNTFRVLYWVVILGALGGAYYYVRPFIGMIAGNSSKMEETFLQLNQLKDQLPETKILNQVLEGLQKSNQGTTTSQ